MADINEKKSCRFKKILFFSIIFIFVASLGFSLFYYVIEPPSGFPVSRLINVEKGSSFKKVAQKFEDEQLIRSPFWFEVFAWMLKKERNVKAGEYLFDRPLNIVELLKSITGSDFKNKLIKITIPEGYDLRDIGSFFESLGMWSREDLFKITGLPGTDCRSSVCVNRQSEFYKVSPLLSQKPENVSMEGYLFPDTYYVSFNTEPDEMVRIFLYNFENKITPELKEAVGKSGHSFFDIINMASLLEKEAHSSDDRKLISGLLWKRMEKGMPLQVDAVFPYIIGKNTFELTTQDLKIDSPYNTYLNKGLPLGPIANPGLDAIKAALFPTASPFWYYLSDKEGKIYYSTNYEEHLVKKAKYLK